jgi:hypothetical protein
LPVASSIGDDVGRVAQGLIAADAAFAVAAAEGKGEAGAGRRERLEPEAGEQARATGIPRVGDDEQRALVKGLETLGFLVLVQHSFSYGLVDRRLAR